jgi:hypothetical protein
MEKTYNGWTNYETWRVNLEVFDGINPSDHWIMDDASLTVPDLGIMLKDYAWDLIETSSQEGLARDYALAFLDAVNWFEIAQAMYDNYLTECEA